MISVAADLCLPASVAPHSFRHLAKSSFFHQKILPKKETTSSFFIRKSRFFNEQINEKAGASSIEILSAEKWRNPHGKINKNSTKFNEISTKFQWKFLNQKCFSVNAPSWRYTNDGFCTKKDVFRLKNDWFCTELATASASIPVDFEMQNNQFLVESRSVY